jgi:hypothetical protein
MHSTTYRKVMEYISRDDIDPTTTRERAENGIMAHFYRTDVYTTDWCKQNVIYVLGEPEEVGKMWCYQRIDMAYNDPVRHQMMEQVDAAMENAGLCNRGKTDDLLSADVITEGTMCVSRVAPIRRVIVKF